MIFCTPAFSQLRISPSGEIKLCCKQRGNIGNSNVTPLNEAMNSDAARRIRVALHRGDWPDECAACRDQESLGAESWRTERSRDFTPEENAQILATVNPDTGEVPPLPSKIEIAFSNLCNVACKMCQPNISTTFGTLVQRSETLKKMFPVDKLMHRAYERPTFMDELVAMLPSLKYLCVTGGEPFMSEEFHRFMDRIGPEKGNITFLTTSNLTQLKHGRLTIMERLSGFKEVQLSISVEGPAVVHEYIRYPSRLDTVLANAQRVRDETQFVLTANITVGALNILRMPEAIETAMRAFSPRHILFSFINEDHLKVECLPTPLRVLAARRLTAYRQQRPYAGTSVEPDIESMITIVLERLKAQGSTSTMIEFLQAQDAVTGQNYLECVPELRPFVEPNADSTPQTVESAVPAAAVPVVTTQTRAEAASNAPVQITLQRPSKGTPRARDANPSPSLCVLPWIHTHLPLSGDMKLCCVATEPVLEGAPRHSIHETPIAELFDSPYMQNVRQQMLAGDWPKACSSCRHKQAMGVRSYRELYNEKFPEYFHTLQTNPAQLQPRLRTLNLWINNLCNFKCRMCSGGVSTRWQEEHDAIYPDIYIENGLRGIHNAERFWHDFHEDIVPELEEIHFAGGEPLLIEEHYKILETLISAGKTDVALRYDTNLSKLTLKHWDVVKLWHKFPRVYLSTSLDGVGAVGEYVRHGLDYQQWHANLARVAKMVPHAERHLHFVISAYNILDFQKHYDTIVAAGLIPQHNIGFTFLEWPPYLSVQTLHPMLKKQARLKLLAMADTDPLVDETCRRYIHGLIEFMERADLYPIHGAAFAEKTRAMDALRKENLLAVAPELAIMLHEHPAVPASNQSAETATQ